MRKNHNATKPTTSLGKPSLNRRSFLRATGMLAAATMTGDLPFRAIAEQSGGTSSKTLVKGRRKLGTLEVSSVGLGCQDFTGTFYATHPNRADMITLARTAHEHGVTLFDAAEAYGPLEVERILGDALAPVRNEVVYSSKFGWNIDPDTGRMMGGLNSRPEHIRRSIDGMLKRWRTDRIDLVYQHRVDPNVPIEDVAGTVKDLIAQGKVLHFGLSEPGPQTLRRAHAVQPVSAVQNEYSMMARDPEDQILSICKELGIGFVCWSPLAMAFLTGAIDQNTPIGQGDFRGMVPWFAPENRPAESRARCCREGMGAAQGSNTCSNCFGLADGTGTMDRSDSRHDQDAAYARQHWRGHLAVQARGSPGVECRIAPHSRSRCAVAGNGAVALRC